MGCGKSSCRGSLTGEGIFSCATLFDSSIKGKYSTQANNKQRGDYLMKWEEQGI
jgi:hypothetical protein